MREVYPNELMHHGIEGQKWGDRNGPPYPLTYAAKSTTEKKYNKSRSLHDQSVDAINSGHKIKGRILEKRSTRVLKSVNKSDTRWMNKRSNKKNFDISSKRYKGTEAQKMLKDLKKELLGSRRNADGSLSKASINSYNQKLADLMNQSLDVTVPSGRVVRWVAKRGEVGVHVGFADRGYDMDQLKNGVWGDGRIAYKKKTVDKT